MFDEHAFLVRNAEEELVKLLLVILAKRAELALAAVLQLDFLGKLLGCEFE
jgi:hypothetical protein